MGSEFDTRSAELVEPTVVQPARSSGVDRGPTISSRRQFGHRLIQAKLSVGEAGDRYEREADEVAAAVMFDLQHERHSESTRDPRDVTAVVTRNGRGRVRRMTAPGRSVVRLDSESAMPPIGPSGGEVGGDTQAAIDRARRGGQPLDDKVRRVMESSFGADFSGVRVHADSGAHDLSQRIQARAFTTANDIFFGRGEYSPASRGGQHLIAHELTHVVQQGAARSTGAIQQSRSNRVERSVSHDRNPADAPHAVVKVQRSWQQQPMTLVQRLQAQIVVSERKGRGIIEDIKLTGRSPSPFSGTMGAHSTAWTVHTDGIRRQLQGRTLDAAIVRLGELVHEAVTSPQVALAELDNPFAPGGPKLKEAMVRVQLLRAAGYTGSTEAGKTVWLEDYIDAYLNAVNYLPMTTVKSGKKTGDREGSARQNLLAIEGGVDRTGDPEQIQEWFAALFAADTPSAYVKDNSTQGLDLSHVWAVALEAFVRGLRHAYPNAYMDANLDKELDLFLWGLDEGVPHDILDRIARLGDVRGDPEQPELQLLNGAGDQLVGGDLAVQVRFSDKNLVDEVRMEGRTPSPFVGSMGAHSTAWAAHLDAIQGALRGRNLDAAIQAVLALSREAQASPLLDLLVFVLPDQARLLARSQIELQYFQRVMLETGTSELIRTTRLQQLIAAYLQFTNALPLHTAEAADTTGNAEGTHRARLLEFESGCLFGIKGRRATKGTKGKKGRPAVKAVSAESRLETAFWGMYDPGSARSFTENLFPSPLPPPRRPRLDGREPRKKKRAFESRDRVAASNRDKVDARSQAFREKPLEEGERDVLVELRSPKSEARAAQPQLLLPQAMSLHSFLHTMDMGYPKSFLASWARLDRAGQINRIEKHLNLDGNALLTLIERLPKQQVIRGTTKLKIDKTDRTSTAAAPRDAIDFEDDGLRAYEQASARRDAIATQYVVGHASGTWNACLIYSLLRHALGRDATPDEVKAVRRNLIDDHPDIENERQINIYSPTGHAVIEAIEDLHDVSLNVAVVTNREAPVVPVCLGVTPALLYLMPGHFAPCWRRE